ncbi:MAG TPA: hypothetical protein VNR66_15060 [Solirubrobacteraceae bacterium]|nr:hypothetical protein [Solirubrobacteraceae bacterium]
MGHLPPSARAARSTGPPSSRPTRALWRVRGSSAAGSGTRRAQTLTPATERGNTPTPNTP